MTPLLDLAFVLLIIFVITTPLLEQGIDITLPTASPSHSNIDPHSVKTVSVDKNGTIYLEKRPVSISELTSELVQWHQADPNLAVVLRADKDIRYQKLVDVFDALQRAKITRMGLMNTSDESHR